jgi:AcrR family transcriptional regulator
VTTTNTESHGRTTYRHGDLSRALVDAGVELARSGGPAAVVLREATRRAGVSPNAAYRHFADRHALLEAVCSECQSGVARAIEDEQAALPGEHAASALADTPALPGTPAASATPGRAGAHATPAIAQTDAAPAPTAPLTAATARLRFRAVGTGYLRFALAEPGLFRTAFTASSDLDSATSAARAGSRGLTPFQLLGEALDDLVTTGVLPAERRPGAEFLAWSAVHGLASLLLDGPLTALSPEATEALIGRVVTMVEQGL